MEDQRLMTLHPRALTLALAALFAPASGAQLAPLTVDLHENVPEFGADLGFAVAAGDINGDGYDDAVLGAPHADVGAAIDAGRVVVRFGPSFTSQQILSAPIPQASAEFGYAVACGDINGDGRCDVVVGAPTETVGLLGDVGRVYIYLGPALTTVTTLDMPAGSAAADFGQALAIGDVVGDGTNDLVVGAPEAQVAGATAGRTLVFTGPAFGLAATVSSPAPGAGRQFGWTVATANIDGTGKADVIVGEPNAPVGALVEAGKAYVYLSSGVALTLSATLTEPTPELSAEFGRTLATGDINNDGFGDIAANVADGAPLSAVDAGEVFVFFGPALGAPTQLREPVLEPGADFGWSLAIGDVNGDGFGDVVIGAQDSTADNATQTHPDSGEAFLFFGPGLGTSQQLIPSVIHTDDDFGHSAATGDFNGDGLHDPLIGAKDGEVTGIADQGRAFAFVWQTNFGTTSMGLSAANGGLNTLMLDGGIARAGRPYAMLGGSLGSSPGFHNGQVQVPVNIDPLLLPILLTLPGAIGTLDGTGKANAFIGAPPGVIPPAAIGLRLTFAWITTDVFNFASLPVVIEVTP